MTSMKIHLWGKLLRGLMVVTLQWKWQLLLTMLIDDKDVIYI